MDTVRAPSVVIFPPKRTRSIPLSHKTPAGWTHFTPLSRKSASKRPRSISL